MNLLETLKQLKSIQADPSYTQKSRLVVLASPQRESRGFREIFIRVAGFAGPLALAGILIFAVGGGLSVSRYFSPVSFQGIDPVALHAEAQEIDMQINLADLNYTENISATQSTPMVTVAQKVSPLFVAASSSQTSTQEMGVMEATSTTSIVATSSAPATSTSINQALQELAQ